MPLTILFGSVNLTFGTLPQSHIIPFEPPLHMHTIICVQPPIWKSALWLKLGGVIYFHYFQCRMQPFCSTLRWKTRPSEPKDCLMSRQFVFNKYEFTSRKPAPLNDQILSAPFSEPYLSSYRCRTTNMATRTHHPSMDPVSFYLFSWGRCCLRWKSWCAGIAVEMSDPYSWTTMRKNGKINMSVPDLTFPKSHGLLYFQT